jgi:hypothetical protein
LRLGLKNQPERAAYRRNEEVGHAMERKNWELDELLERLPKNNWTMYCFGEPEKPDAIAAVKVRKSYADVFILRGPEEAAAYRTPLLENMDPLEADHLLWRYVGRPVHVLRAVLTICPESMATRIFATPDDCKVPETGRRPYTIRPGQMLNA